MPRAHAPLVRAFWWRPGTGPPAQAALDAWNFRPRRPVNGRIHHWRLRNFGDELTPFLIHAADSRLKVVHAGVSHADLVAVGSVMERAVANARRGVLIAGPGFIDCGSPISAPRGLDFRLVRGHLTRERLGLPVGLPVGDPALSLATERREPTRDPSPLVILHYGVLRHRRAKQIVATVERKLGASAIFSSDPVGAVLDAVRNASVVFSTSLHGVILADAYDIPALPITLGETSRDYRFDDYHSSLAYRSGPRLAAGDLDAVAGRKLAERRQRELGAAPSDVGHGTAAVLLQVIADLSGR